MLRGTTKAVDPVDALAQAASVNARNRPLPSGIPTSDVTPGVAAGEMYNYIRSKGVDHEHAVGMLANIQGESGFNPSSYVKNDNGGGPSGGLFQHHNERLTAMSKAVPDWKTNWKGQIDFALGESETQKYLGTKYKDGSEATVGFVKHFEKPKYPEQAAARRAEYVPAIERIAAHPGDPAGAKARALDPNSDAYKRIGALVDQYSRGTLGDPTGGATHYYNPHVVSPKWAGPLATHNDRTIGNHRFVGRIASPYPAGAYASGGLVEEPDDTEPDADSDEGASAGTSEAIPTSSKSDYYAEGKRPHPSQPGTGSDPLDGIGEAIGNGLKYIQHVFGLNGASAAEAVPTSGQSDGWQRLMSGEGAASPEEVRAIGDIVDPKQELTDGLRTAVGLNAAFKVYVAHGEPAKAAKIAQALVLHGRMLAATYGDQAVQLLQRGDIAGGVEALKKGKDSIPDGTSVSAKVNPDGTADVTHTGPNGQRLAAMRATPQQLMGWAVGLRDGSAYWNELIRAASGQYGADQEDPALDQYLAERANADRQATREAIPTEVTPAGNGPAGQIEPGNIDLNNRPVVKNPDGSISTVRSMSVGIDGKEVLIPTVSEDGRIMSDEEAVAQFRKTGRHLGKFDIPQNASAYAESLHNQQAQRYLQIERMRFVGAALQSFTKANPEPQEPPRELLMKMTPAHMRGVMSAYNADYKSWKAARDSIERQAGKSFDDNRKDQLNARKEDAKSKAAASAPMSPGESAKFGEDIDMAWQSVDPEGKIKPEQADATRNVATYLNTEARNGLTPRAALRAASFITSPNQKLVTGRDESGRPTVMLPDGSEVVVTKKILQIRNAIEKANPPRPEKPSAWGEMVKGVKGAISDARGSIARDKSEQLWGKRLSLPEAIAIRQKWSTW